VNLELELALRFLRRRTGLLLRGTALAAFAGVALATAALVITLALMTGYSRAITTALHHGSAHMVGFALGQLEADQAQDLALQIGEIEGVQRATSVTYLTGLMNDPNEPSNPIPITLKAVADPPSYTGFLEWPADDGLSAVLGERLADQTGIGRGDIASIQLPPEARSWILPTLRLDVVGTFRLAFAEFDEHWIIVPLDDVLDALPGSGVAGIEIELSDPMDVDQTRAQLEAIDSNLLFTDWREMNSSLFAALRWQTLSLFVVLCLVVAVASFQVSSALVVLAIDKQRSTGMLQALGATPANVRRILILSGLLLGGSGILAGIAVGALTSWIMSAFRIIRFPPGLAKVYMVDSIPLVTTPRHLAAVAGVCLILVLLASIWPAWKTSRQDPVAALRAV
jgi:lipoprotein-releasing system permease protein